MTRQGSSGVGAAGSSATAAPSAAARPENSVLAYISTDAAALDCGVCYLPLKPPIVQCEVGHVLCSPCRDKQLAATGKCHVCGADTSKGDGHRRCHAMERVVESIRVPCPNAAYGCTATPAYCDKQSHLQEACLHAPCYCPGEACRFAGTMDALVDHLAGAHGWPPCEVIARDDMSYVYVQLNDGFNFFVLDDDMQGDTTTAAAATSSRRQFLLLLDVARRPLARAISVLLIHPHAGASGDNQRLCLRKMRCKLKYSRSRSVEKGRFLVGEDCSSRREQLLDHDLKSEIQISCTDLSSGLPDPDESREVPIPRAQCRCHKQGEGQRYKRWFQAPLSWSRAGGDENGPEKEASFGSR